MELVTRDSYLLFHFTLHSSHSTLNKEWSLKMDVFQKIAEIIADHTGGDVSTITEATTFEELGVDSLDTVEMVMKLEEDLGVELELESKFNTVGELAKFVESKMG